MQSKDVAKFDNAVDMYKSGLIDAVVVAVPHYQHPELVIAAFEHGLHALTEKPAGVYTKQVREMNEAAEKVARCLALCTTKEQHLFSKNYVI